MFYASVNISMFSVFLPSLLLCWVAAKYRQIIDNKICYLVRLGLCTTRGLVGLCKLCFSLQILLFFNGKWKPPLLLLRKKGKLKMEHGSFTPLSMQIQTHQTILTSLQLTSFSRLSLVLKVKVCPWYKHSLSALFTVGHCVGVLPLSWCLCTGLIAGDHTSVRLYSGGHYTHTTTIITILSTSPLLSQLLLS